MNKTNGFRANKLVFIAATNETSAFGIDISFFFAIISKLKAFFTIHLYRNIAFVLIEILLIGIFLSEFNIYGNMIRLLCNSATRRYSTSIVYSIT